MPTSKNYQLLQDWLRFSPWLLGLGFVFWLGSFTLFGLSMDQEIALANFNPSAWLSQGRWAIFLIVTYLYPQPVLAYFPHLILLFCLTASFVLFISALEVPLEKKWLVLLSFPVFVAYPVWYFIAEFYANLIPTALGTLACTIAAWLFAQQMKKTASALPTALSFGLQSLLVFFAMGTYQSLLFMAAAMYLILLLVQLFQEQSRTYIIKNLAYIAALLLSSVVVNQLWLELLYALHEVEPSYVNNMINLQATLKNLGFTMRSALADSYILYTGSFYDTKSKKLSLLSYSLVVAVGAFYTIRYSKNKGFSLLLVIAIFLVPFSLNFITGALASIPYRSNLAVAIIVWLFGFLALSLSRHQFIKGLCIVLVLISNVQILHLHARYNSETAMLYDYNKRVAAQLFERILQVVPDYDMQSIQLIDMEGSLPYTRLYGNVMTTTIGQPFTNTPHHTAARNVLYMEALNIRNLQAVSEEQRLELAPIYKTMPSWPASGSVRYQDGVVLIKLS